MELHTNEIRDYLTRAPKRWSFNGHGMINHTHVRLKWLCDLARGTLDDKINRRAGIVPVWRPWANPVWSAIRRHRRKAAKSRRQRPCYPMNL